MFEQFNNQVIQFSKQMSETMIKANTLVVDQFEKMAEVQLKGFEMRANAAAEMVEVASSVKSPEDFRFCQKPLPSSKNRLRRTWLSHKKWPC
jgi:hypothetical protein